ncbi:hypothetical protein OO014_03325 [Intrasporangium calvum]|uniref:Uncharacterized protein n=1 Tax=Intrasporangium calvum TaxID=53358 RepID=A0ABT5GDB2_9MICO|nr:hypothetical protein [Intrasporangium calvum]MDC5696275.1 hypothetical protein [Intrasporangium calvum]
MASTRDAGAGRPDLQDPDRAAGRRADLIGLVALVLGFAAVAALIWLWALTLPNVNPPNWVRILGVLWLPVGVVGAGWAGLLGLRGPGRRWSVVGLSLAGLAVVGFVTLIATASY